ncbi:MAG: segregation ATPase, FtsK/SpoIIIE family [Planctomycetota bacterium]|nr:segregation ATPase, FtsK/SpoIIIE family [Planctomycetota bacterium]
MTATNTSLAEPIPTPTNRSDGDGVAESGDLYRTWTEIPGELARFAAERSTAEDACRTIHAAAVRRASLAHREAIELAEQKRRTETVELAQTCAEAREQSATQFTSEIQSAESERLTLRKTANARYRRTIDEAQTAHEAAKWEAGTMFETSEKGSNEWRKEMSSVLANERESISVLKTETELVFHAYRGFVVSRVGDSTQQAIEFDESDDPFPALHTTLEEADALLVRLEALRLPNAFRGPRMAWVFLLPILLLAYPSWYLLGLKAGAAVCIVVAVAIGFVLRGWIVRTSRSKIDEVQIPLLTALSRSEALAVRAQSYVANTFEQRIQAATRRRDTDLTRAEQTRISVIEKATRMRDDKIRDADEAASRRAEEATSIKDRIVREVAETESRRKAEISVKHAAALASADARHRQAIESAEARQRADWQSLADSWSTVTRKLLSDTSAIHDTLAARFPDWAGFSESSWRPISTIPQAIKFGDVTIPLDRIPGGISEDPRLRAMAPDAIHLPALLSFPERASVTFEFAGEAGRKRSIEAMQALMLRFLTALPPGKIRFTILDPLGLGRNFAAFMHLADYAEALVNTRIWTEPQQIDQRLSELNLHIETVIQNYLRNEFPTIEAYNEQAAEVAEPYRVLVVADFPAGFSEPTAKRLAAIARSGPRCGLYLILGLDTSQALPPSITKDEIVKSSVRISWRDGRFLLRNPVFEPFPLILDEPPPPEPMTRLLHRLGEAARDANRVEVPFEVIAPKPEDYWKGDSGSSISVPLGRSGATKLQALKLGRGTSQHVLTAGRTGSGKSTLLHALITNSALIYGPDEIELYLIDFKKGVEFKTYATHALPHARVIAVESEREFGLSVLQRLDSELKNRGDTFRDLGVQDLAGYRATGSGTPLPRVLLIVDEFQEFFVEDDKLAQETALLLDRLVRQGRAFGIHVILGSQTLSGAYSLARSTLGQMAVRIALQCSEADAHLILNEENAAARLLSRPGEAIYNDANGQVEGNHVFQVVWLTDAKREAYLKALAQLARDRHITPRPQIVFEGNKPSDLTQHPVFSQPRSEDPTQRFGIVHAWLGEAVAIKDPTSAPFRAQGGSNLLVIGQNDEMAIGIAVAGLLGLAAQLPRSARFYALDGTPEDSPFSGRIKSLVEILPQSLQLGGTRDTAAILADVTAEVERRQANSGETIPMFLFIHDLPRFRDLRKQDDDFSYGRRGEEKAVSPAKLFSTILREGPALGVHTIIWCDSLNNANRAFDRQALREFEMRVLFQMSPADSSNLIDSPVANRLGENRAFFSSEEAGKLEKFRPYGLPPADWLDALRAKWNPAG